MRDCPDGQTFIKYLNGPGGTCVKDVWGDSGDSNGSNDSGGSGALSASQMRQRETLALAGLGLAFFFLLALLS